MEKEKAEIIIKNATVVTMNANSDVLTSAAVAIKDRKICAVGPTADILDHYEAEERCIEANDNIIFPGLVNLHFHSAIGKGFFEGQPLDEVLNNFWYPMIREVTPEEAYWAAMCSYSESLRAGTTCVNDMWRQMDSCADAAADIGIRAALCCDIATEENGLDTLETNEQVYNTSHGKGDGRVEVYIGLEWMPLASVQLLKDMKVLQDKLGTKVHLHLNESVNEIAESRRLFGRRPLELANDCGLLSPECIAAHCVWLTDEEIRMVADSGASISHNPTSNSKLGNGIARLTDLQKAGINIGIGHDDASSNNCLDMFSSMKFASLLHRTKHEDRNILQAEQMLRMSTVNGSKAMSHNSGTVEAGKDADIIMIDVNTYHYSSLYINNDETNIHDLIYAADGGDIRMNMVAGDIVMEDRRLTRVDQDEVFAKANQAFLQLSKRIWS